MQWSLLFRVKVSLFKFHRNPTNLWPSYWANLYLHNAGVKVNFTWQFYFLEVFNYVILIPHVSFRGFFLHIMEQISDRHVSMLKIRGFLRSIKFNRDTSCVFLLKVCWYFNLIACKCFSLTRPLKGYFMPKLKKFCLHFAFRELLKLYWYSTYAIFFLFLYSLSENNGILISTEYGIKIQAGQKYHYSDWNLLEREGDFYQLHVANTSRDISTINKVDVKNASPDLQ